MARLVAMVMAAVLAILPLTAAGGPSAAAGDQGAAARLSAQVADNNTFAFEMYKQLSATEQDKNMFFSPLSVSTALGMTYAGARGETERQMAATLRFNLPQDELHAAFAALSDRLKATGAGGYRLSIANALWGQKGFYFDEGFLGIVNRHYQGGFNTVDFAGDTEGSRQTINSWVERNTADKIKNLLAKDDINELTRLVLTNAIYFKGDWAAKFKPEQTRTAPFYIRPDEKTDVQMMRQTGPFAYAAVDGAQILELPYAGGELSMVVLLPAAGDEDFAARITPDKLAGWLAGLSEQEMAVSLPKFKFEARYGLGPVLSAMGMPDAFDVPPADFSGMTGEKNLYITKVIHQAFIEVNEEGSEAAAATAVVMGVKSVFRPAEFKADRPFVFLIRHKATGAILFLGRVNNPADK
ncbi:MAG TPA: serpin family protein [Negativicutes bacterium]|nr:serpin family protein [Negativicutes bacterium]